MQKTSGADNLTAKDTAVILKQYHEEINELTRQVTIAVGQVDSIRRDYQHSWKNHIHRGFWMALALILLIAAWSIKSFCIQIDDIKISKPNLAACTAPASK